MDEPLNAEELTTYINAEWETDFTLAEKLGGGYQEGAYLLTDPTGRRYALKITPVPRSVIIIQQLREAGYPTPKFLYWGTAPDGTPYLIQEYIPGDPLKTLTLPYTEQLITINRRQAGLNPDPANRAESWADYIRNVVFANESGWSSRVRNHSAETARLMDALDEATAPYAETVLSNDDIVHGDWSHGNILVADGRIAGIIDSAYAGYGPRAYDLATLLHYEYADNGDPAIRARLRDAILTISGKPALMIFLASRILALLDFAISHHGDEGIDAFTQIGWRILRDETLW